MRMRDANRAIGKVPLGLKDPVILWSKCFSNKHNTQEAASYSATDNKNKNRFIHTQGESHEIANRQQDQKVFFTHNKATGNSLGGQSDENKSKYSLWAQSR